jgi:hypothetical protein
MNDRNRCEAGNENEATTVKLGATGAKSMAATAKPKTTAGKLGATTAM